MSSKDNKDAKKTTGDVVVGEGSDPEFAVRLAADNVEGQTNVEANEGQEGDGEYYQNMQNMIDGNPAD